MSILKQRVPLGKDKNGDDVFITIEWLKDLNGVISEAASPSSSASSPDISALTSAVATLTTNLTALMLRVTKLERGYQA